MELLYLIQNYNEDEPFCYDALIFFFVNSEVGNFYNEETVPASFCKQR